MNFKANYPNHNSEPKLKLIVKLGDVIRVRSTRIAVVELTGKKRDS